jgi:lysophospholipase L1-like esterase
VVTPVRAQAVSVAVALDDAEQPAAMERDCPADGERILLIGDSLSAGLGPMMAEHAAACGTSFVHHGVVGSHVTEWAHDSWLLPQLDAARPTTVIVSLGGNDFRRFDPDNVRRGIDTFIAKVRASGARLLWISPPTMPFPDRVGARDMWHQAIDGAEDIAWYPTEALSIPRQEDRVHPTPEGYGDLARTLWRWMSSV